LVGAAVAGGAAGLAAGATDSEAGLLVSTAPTDGRRIIG
jgi:hypothetical protein